MTATTPSPPCSSSSSSLPSSIYTHIFSYLIIHDYRDIAKLRLISKELNQQCLPHLTTYCSHSTSKNQFLRCCYYPKHHENNVSYNTDAKSFQFIRDLCDIEEEERRGGTFDLKFLNDNEDNTCTVFKKWFCQQYGLKFHSMFIVEQYWDEKLYWDEIENANKEIIKKETNHDIYCQSLCHELIETHSFDEMNKLGQEAFNIGLFLPKDGSATNYENDDDCEEDDGGEIICLSILIMTVEKCMESLDVNYFENGSVVDLCLFDKDRKKTCESSKNEDKDSAIPDQEKDEDKEKKEKSEVNDDDDDDYEDENDDNNNEEEENDSDVAMQPRKCDIGKTFNGYVRNDKIYIPICLRFHEDYFADEGADSCIDLMPVREILDKHQYSYNVQEGVAIVDNAIPMDLHEKLMKEIDLFAQSQETVDYHPHSNNVVRDLVHPALYPYVKGISPVKEMEKVLPCVFTNDNVGEQTDGDGGGNTTTNGDTTAGNQKDYWGRPYEASSKYQWLPTYFDIGTDGSCTICDYINNLVPRSNHTELYSLLEELFSQALPQLESVYSYGRSVRPRLRNPNEFQEYDDTIPPLIEEKYCSLKGQRLQVITKIVDYELLPGESYEGVWHVEGMSHEEIVATAIYFLQRDDDLRGGNIMFKRAFHKKEATYIFSSVPQCRATKQEEVIRDGLIPLGQVETLHRRLLVFPNSHVHKVRKIQNHAAIDSNDTMRTTSSPVKQKRRVDESGNSDVNNAKKSKRRIVVFFLINPEKRLISTREIEPQQTEAGGKMNLEEAFEHRLELMKERKYTKQDWNVREIELCEH